MASGGAGVTESRFVALVIAAGMGGALSPSACLPGPRVLDRPPASDVTTESAQVRAARAGQPVDGPFRVLLAGPTGEELVAPQPQVVFSEPMIALGDPHPPELAATFSPAISGHWEWQGSSAARFVPSAPFAPATRYRLQIPAGLRAASGATLAKDTTIEFATPRPSVDVPGAITDGVGWPADSRVRSRDPVRLRFRGGARKADVEAHLRVVAHLRNGHGEQATRLSFSLAWPDRGDERTRVRVDDDADELWLEPDQDWPPDTTISLAFGEGIRGSRKGGPLTMRPSQLHLRTAELPHVVRISCHELDDGRCTLGEPGPFPGGVIVELSEPMRASDLRKLVSVEPWTAFMPPDRGDGADAPAKRHWVSLSVQPNLPYTLRVRPSPLGAAMPDGLLPLAVGDERTLVFAPRDSGVRFSFAGVYLLPRSVGSPEELRVRVDDAPSARGFVLPLTRDLVMRLQRGEIGYPAPGGAPFRWEEVGAREQVLPVRASLHAPVRWASLESALPFTQTSPVLFAAEWGVAPGGRSISQVLQRSELAMVTRVAHDEALVWVTELRTGEPSPGVAVEVRDLLGRSVEGVTGPDGVVRVALTKLVAASPDGDDDDSPAGREVVVFAQRGDDWIYQAGVIPRALGLDSATFTDRGLYRPGERVRLFGVVARKSKQGYQPLVDKSVDLTVSAPDGRQFRTTGHLDAFGAYAADFDAPMDASLGRYEVSGAVEGAPCWGTAFQIRDYRPTPFALSAAFDKKDYQRGDRATCAAQADYLYGGSLQGGRVDVHVKHAYGIFRPPGLEGFTVSPARDWTHRADQAETLSLDDHGRASLAVAVGHPSQVGPELVTCSLLASDAGQDSLGASVATIVHPAAVYAALEPTGGEVTPGRRLEPRVLAVRPDGTREKRPVRLSLMIVRQRHIPGWGEVEQVDESPAATCVATPGDEPASCALLAPRGPYAHVNHFELRASVIDDQGREARASDLLQAGASPTIARSPRRDVGPQFRDAALAKDKTAYEIGETATLTATPPFTRGHMLVTLETGSLLQHFVRPVGADPQTISVPIDRSVAPMAVAQLTAVAPLADKNRPDRQSSTIEEIRVSPAGRMLSVTIAPERLRSLPGEDLDVDVEVRRRDGTAAEASVTLYSADEGTLLLAGYELPDPLRLPFGWGGWAVRGEGTRANLATTLDWVRARGPVLAEISGGGSVSVGRDDLIAHGGPLAGVRDLAPRRDMRQTAFFLPGLLTDASGHVRRRVRLPESLTRQRIMAFAITKQGDAGSGQASVVVQKPLQVRASVPRVIRLGDRFQLGAMVANNGEEDTRDCIVSVEVDGTTLAARGATIQPVTLPPKGSQRLTFEVEATGIFPRSGGALGPGIITTSLQCGTDGDAVESRYVVDDPVVLDTVTVFGQTTSRFDQPLVRLDDVNKGVGGLDVTLSTSPLAGLADAFSYLIHYPYECVEQSVSRLVALLTLRDRARALNVPLPSDLDGATRALVAKIEAGQRQDGGFSVWAGWDEEPWLTAYAAWGLEEARRLHVPAKDAAVDKARARLFDRLHRFGSPDSHEHPAAAALALDVLAEVAETSPGAMDRRALQDAAAQLFERRAQLSVDGRALLLDAMARLGDEARGPDTTRLVDELVSMVRIDGRVARVSPNTAVDDTRFGSDARTNALVLRALAKASPKHPLLAPLAFGLVSDRQAGTWRTTQETAWALRALDAFQTTQQAREGQAAATLGGARVELDGALLWRTDFGGVPGVIPPDAHAVFPIETLLPKLSGTSSRRLSFEAEDQPGAPLFFQALLRTAPAVLPGEPWTAGFEVKRSYSLIPSRFFLGSDLAGKREPEELPTPSVIQEGDLLLVRVDVAASAERHLVVVDDPLPGGFEPIDPQLQLMPRWLTSRLTESSAGARVELRDDRALYFLDRATGVQQTFVHAVRAARVGTFVAPPARAEEMYRPEIFGRTGASYVEIAPR